MFRVSLLGHQTPLHAGPEGKTGSGMSAVVSGFLSGYLGTFSVLPGREDWNWEWGVCDPCLSFGCLHDRQEGQSGAQEEEDQVRLGTSAE